MMVPKFHSKIHMLEMEHHLSNYGNISSSIANKGKANCVNIYSANFFKTRGTENCSPELIQKHDDNFFKSIKSFLIFGKFIGVLPFSGIFGNSSKNLSFRKNSISAMISYGIVAVLIFNIMLSFINFYKAPKRNALEISNAFRLTVYSSWGLLVYITFLYRGHKFLHIFKVWNSIKVTYSRKDVTLRRDIFLIAGGIYTSAILENMVIHMEYFKGADKFNGNMHKDKHNNMTHMETYYWRAHSHWATVIGYNWVFTVLAFFHHKWLLYSWNYIDILIAIFGRAMYFRFKCLYQEARNKLLEPEELRWSNSRPEICNDDISWMQLVRDHHTLCELLEVLENFFSPMILGGYLVNIYFICMQLIDGLANENFSNSIVHSIYAPWSFLHLVVRTFVVSICCAQINVYAHRIRNVLKNCPSENYSKDVSRIDIQVTAGPDIGLTGMGCFTVTKPFILKIISVVFTFEIVLLQCIPIN